MVLYKFIVLIKLKKLSMFKNDGSNFISNIFFSFHRFKMSVMVIFSFHMDVSIVGDLKYAFLSVVRTEELKF